MREFIQCNTRRAAKRLAPWACAWLRCDGGFMAFTSADDARTWEAQR